MDKLTELLSKCKCSVSLVVNEHRDNYETVEQYFNSTYINAETLANIDKEVYEKMKELNTIIELHIYPHTPIGSYTLFDSDLNNILHRALQILKTEQQ